MIQGHHVSSEQISHHYDELDEFYRELWGTHLHHGLWLTGKETKEEAQENLSREVLSYLYPLEGKNLVDVGSGYGETAKLGVLWGAQRVTGVTISEKQFDYARTHTDDLSVDYQLSDWLDSDFPENSFDGGYSIECFSHIQNKRKFFQTVYRTLKPGATFVMSAWLASVEPSPWQRKMILEPICSEGRLPSLYNKDEILDAMEANGLEFFDYVDLSQKVARTWMISTEGLLSLFAHVKGLKYFLNPQNEEKRFALTILRILLGYKLGCFQYCIFVMKKPLKGSYRGSRVPDAVFH